MKKQTPLQGFIQAKKQEAKEAEARKKAYEDMKNGVIPKAPKRETKKRGKIGVYDVNRKK